MTILQQGNSLLQVVQHEKSGITIIAHDDGPGIPDIDLALQDGYSTSNSLGRGLPGTKRIMDEFAIVSEVGKGTTITMRKWKPRETLAIAEPGSSLRKRSFV